MRADKFKLTNLQGKEDIQMISDSISKLDGVNAVRVDTMANTVTVDYDDNKISSSEIEAKLKEVHNRNS